MSRQFKYAQTNFQKIFKKLFKNMSRQFKFQQNPTRITGTLCEDQYTYFIIFRSVLLRIGNVLDKIVKNIKTQFIFSNLFENRAFYETMWKNIVELSRPQMTVWRMSVLSSCNVTRGCY